MEIKIHNTYISPDASKRVNEVLSSTFISEGTVVKEFEKQIENNFNLNNFVALNSGTSALHLALVLAGIKEGDEVILPAQTFVATGLVILQQNAVPVFADIDYETGNISVESIRNKITTKTKAILPVHWGGYPCDMDEIITLGKDYNLTVIEDAAHALGASYKNRPIGSISDFTCFSFQAIKHLTTGDGGAICAINNQKYSEAIIKRWFGIDRNNSSVTDLGERNYNIKELGFKYHMNNYAAALGLANLSGLKDRLAKRVQIAKFYTEELNNINGLKVFNYSNDRQSAYWLFGLHVEKRVDFMRALKEKGIETSVIHQRIDRNSVFGNKNNELPYQKKFDETQVHIPIHDALTEINIEKIVGTIKAGW